MYTGLLNQGCPHANTMSFGDITAGNQLMLLLWPTLKELHLKLLNIPVNVLWATIQVIHQEIGKVMMSMSSWRHTERGKRVTG